MQKQEAARALLNKLVHDKPHSETGFDTGKIELFQQIIALQNAMAKKSQKN